MKYHIQHSKRIKVVNYFTKDYDHYFSVFKAAFAMVLLYGYDPHTEYSIIKGKAQLFSELEQYLESNFFDKLYVNTSSENDLKNVLFNRKLCVLSGPTGCGKTTLIQKICMDLENDNMNNFLIYVDAKKLFSPSNNVPICYLLEDYIYNILFPETHSNVFQKSKRNPNITIEDYEVYELRNNPHYFALRNIIHKSEKPQSDNEWKKILRKKYYRTKKNELDLSLPKDEDTSTVKLEILCKYLKLHYDHVLIFLDNIDRFNLDNQRKIFSKAIDLCSLTRSTPVLSLRTQNFRRLISESSDADLIFFETLEGIDKEERHIQIMKSVETIRSFLRKRINVIENLPSSYQTSRTFYTKHLESKFELSYDEFNKYFWHFFEEIVSNEKSIIILNKWCNGSIRSLAVLIFNIVVNIITNKDPMISLESMLLKNKKIKVRRYRSYLYKYFMCGEELLYMDSNKLLNNFFEPDTSRSQFGKLYYLDIKLLTFLHNYPQDYITYGDLCRFFKEYGVKKEDVFSTIDQNRISKNSETFGFVYVDRIESKINIDMDDDTKLSLLPAGKFMIEKLISSCEYIFWCALDTKTEFQLFKGRIEYEQTHEDKFKLEVCTTYLRYVLLPQYRSEMKSLIIGRKKRIHERSYQKYINNFCLDKKTYLERACNSLREFIKDSKLKADQLTVVTSNLKYIEDIIKNEHDELSSLY